ncbi:hypothetical protein [Staphylococcus gallinarum]|uniref:hypothetical protein n=1 Tax=Staphylococcus gallinarum TaxID=1293 RepID=UPI00316BAA95
MNNIFDGFHYNPMQRLRIFSILTYFNKKAKKNNPISIESISKQMKAQDIKISNQNIYIILSKYNSKGQFQSLFHNITFDK